MKITRQRMLLVSAMLVMGAAILFVAKDTLAATNITEIKPAEIYNVISQKHIAVGETKTIDAECQRGDTYLENSVSAWMNPSQSDSKAGIGTGPIRDISDGSTRNHIIDKTTGYHLSVANTNGESEVFAKLTIACIKAP